MNPTVIVLSIGVMGLFINYFNKPNKILAKLDAHSLLIYYVHPIFIIFYEKLLKMLGININHAIVTIILICSVTITSIIFASIYQRFKNKALFAH